MPIRVQIEDFDTGSEIAKLRLADPKIGAVVTFVGQVRDINEEQSITALTLEHYPGMTEKVLHGLVQQAKTRWLFFDALIIHRIGTLLPQDQIVLVAVAGPHRGDCFSACEFLMDTLKTEAPFWKKEQRLDGSHWVAARESDRLARQQWLDEKQESS